MLTCAGPSDDDCLRGGPALQNFVAIAALALPLLLKLLLLCLVAKRLGPSTAISPHSFVA